MVDETLRDEYALDGVAPKIADATAGDPVLASQLVAWLLEADPDRHIVVRRTLGEKLATRIGAERDDVDAFLQKLADRIYGHFDLIQLRQDGKLNVIFRQIQELTGLEEMVRIAFCDQAETLREIIETYSIDFLHPVHPESKPPSKKNTLLSGSRPGDEDMDQDIDFRRIQFEPVLKAILSSDSLPKAYVFLAEIQRGKTTFLKRVGWELARHGFPVLQLSQGALLEPYGERIAKHVNDISDKPLILLLDDILKKGEHAQEQLNVLHERSIPVVSLITAWPEHWGAIKRDRVPLLQNAEVFNLNPVSFEADLAIQKLQTCGLIHVADTQMESLRKAVSELPIGEGYFGEVIRIASRDEYKPMPMLIAEHLERCDDSETVEAFKKAYRYICVPGIVGMPLPENVYRLLVPETTREVVRRFVATMPIPPIREEDGAFTVTHEAHAEAGLVDADLGTMLKEMIETLIEDPKCSMFWGILLELLRIRGASQFVIETWTIVADRVTDEHWNACDPQILSRSWGALFYHEKYFELAAHVNSIAVHRNPDSSIAHNNYAIVLEELRRNNEALEHYETALGINPEYANAHYNYAVLLNKLERDDEALEHYETALGINPEYADAHYNYANLLVKRERDNEALTHYEAALRIKPESAIFHNNYAILMEKLGRDDEALNHYKTARRINPENAESHANIAKALLKRGDIERSLDHAVQAVRLQSLPDRGVRIPGWYKDHIDALEEIAGNDEQSPERRGGALAILIANKSEHGLQLAKEWEGKPECADSLAVCQEILEIWVEAAREQKDKGE